MASSDFVTSPQAQRGHTSSGWLFQPLTLALALIASPVSAGGDGCGWAHAFHSRGMNDEVHALITWDVGTGHTLFAGGEFTRIGDRALPALARRDGDLWRPVLGEQGGGFQEGDDVFAFAIWDDGSGEKLYADGDDRSLNCVTSHLGPFGSMMAAWFLPTASRPATSTTGRHPAPEGDGAGSSTP